jgi:hypothetical protein
MVVLATPIVDWNAMWKILVVVLVAGAGVVVAFGLMLLGLKLSQGTANRDAGANGTESARTVRTPSGGARLGGFTLALVCGLICVGVIAVGVYAMTQKPKSKPAKPKSALVLPAGSRVRLIASSR